MVRGVDKLEDKIRFKYLNVDGKTHRLQELFGHNSLFFPTSILPKDKEKFQLLTI